MNRRSLPDFPALWKRHEELYLKLFSKALGELAQKDSGASTLDENLISDQLAIILNRICFEVNKTTKQEISKPLRELPIQPVEPKDLSSFRQRKKPDFTCDLINTFADSPEDNQISFHVECKKLGSPTSMSWILNKNYITEGMSRFDQKSHEYGNRAPSGVMIGYLVNMTFETVLDEVNVRIRQLASKMPEIKFILPALGKTIKTRQDLTREFVSPKKFALFHLWVDLI